MPSGVLFCFLTVPFLVGVAFTLAFSFRDNWNGLAVVLVVAALWSLAAYRLKLILANALPNKWVSRWMILSVPIPLLALFGLSIRDDPQIVAAYRQYVRRAEAIDSRDLAVAAPSRHIPSWGETRQILASVHPLAIRFSIQLLKSLPPAWWVAAFLISIRKGK